MNCRIRRFSLAFLLSLPLVSGRPLSGESAKREFLGPFSFVHPADQRWTPPALWSSPLAGRFYGTHGFVSGADFYFYIGGGAFAGATSGPGSECPLEDVMIFSVPYTREGLRGQSGIKYLGVATPCDVAHYTGGTVFRDPSRGNKVYMIVTRTPKPQVCSSEFCDLRVGESNDNGKTWSWSPFMTVTNGIKIPDGMHVQPDPGRPGVWFGVFEFSSRISGPVNATGFVRINWNTGTIYIADQVAPSVRWRPLIGGILDFMPATAWATRVSDLANVGGGRYELWSGVSTARSTEDPCPNGPTQVYIQNTSGTTQGEKLKYRTLTPDFVLGNVLEVITATPAIRPIPSDYNLAMSYPFRLNEPSGRQHLYTSTLDPTICNVAIPEGTFRSLGVVVTVLENVP